ncbi:MAG TPA: SDR family oxidoreductase [Gemmatimonadales bacterium]|nr:SDR family oxidoreductase [Gemmatimonadales bacterium]
MAAGTALVTGASAGIGREFCRQLAARGLDLIVVARDAARLDTLADELGAAHGVRVEALPADLTRDADVNRVAERAANHPALTLVVNNAGFGTVGSLATAPPEQQEAMLRLHVLAPMRLTRAALPGMLSRRQGGIINVSSVAGFLYSPGNVNYCASKAYLTTFTEGLALELAGTGVTAQALCPGFTHTEFHQRMGPDSRRRPPFMWLTAEAVVRASLRQLDRGGPVVCVPGLRYKVLVALLRLLPRRAIGLLTGPDRPGVTDRH